MGAVGVPVFGCSPARSWEWFSRVGSDVPTIGQTVRGGPGCNALLLRLFTLWHMMTVYTPVISDRLFSRPEQRVTLAAGYSLACAILLGAAFALPAGPPQLVLLGLAIFLAAGTTGPAGAMVAGLTPAAIHGTAFATLTLANNVLGLAPGPIVTGWLADRVGLLGALQWLPLPSIAAALVFLCARQSSRAQAAFAE